MTECQCCMMLNYRDNDTWCHWKETCRDGWETVMWSDFSSVTAYVCDYVKMALICNLLMLVFREPYLCQKDRSRLNDLEVYVITR